MIFNWTFFIVCSILATGSLICLIANIYEYLSKKGKGENRFVYTVSIAMFTLFAAAVADVLFN